MRMPKPPRMRKLDALLEEQGGAQAVFDALYNREGLTIVQIAERFSDILGEPLPSPTLSTWVQNWEKQAKKEMVTT